NWNPELRAPLTEPGVKVQEGDYLLAVNGKPLTGKDEIFRFFEQTAGKAVRLTVGADPSGKGSREVQVVPIGDEESLRLRAWVEENRRRGGGGLHQLQPVLLRPGQPPRRRDRRALQRRRLGGRLHHRLVEPAFADEG